MKVLSLFSGIGAFEKALDRQGIDYELVGFSEIDKYATKSYCAIHNVDESMNLGDITKVDEKTLPKDIDLLTYGFPCQDISLAGKGKGLFNADGTKTRSGLFFDALRIIEEAQPKVAIAENVKNLTGKKFKLQFEIVLKMLEAAGYNNYWQVLNAKDYGIPQNRERVFIVSIRKDIDTGFFQFPEGFPLELRLKDILEKEVDEKFYISDEKIRKIVNSNFGQEKAMIQRGDICGTLLARDYKDPKCVQVFQMYGTEKEPNPQAGRIYSAEGISPTMDSCSGGNRMPKVLVNEPVCLNSKGGRGGVEGLQPSIQDRVYDSNAISTAVTTCFMPSYLVEEPTIQRVDIPQTVSVRKYEVDTDKLVQVLRSHKESSKMTNKTLAEELDLPITKVEHWFRQDDCFAIPDAEVWLKLKELLQIETDEFDESIMTFEEKEGVYEKSERHYFADGIMPTLTSTSAGNEKIIVREATKQGYAVAEEGDSINIGFPNSKTRRGRVGKQIAGTLTTSSEMAVVVPSFVNGDVCKTVRASGHGSVDRHSWDMVAVQEPINPMPLPNGMWRIRKLTPKECWRLMGFDDEDFEKAEAVNSNTQLYKQAGNSIVVDVLEHIYQELQKAGALND